MAVFKYSNSGATHMVAGTGNVQMVMIARTAKEFFTTFIEREAKANGFKAVVNGSYVDLSFVSKVAVKSNDEPLDASDSQPVGRVIQNGKLLAGSSSTGKFYFSQNVCGIDKFTSGPGDPPSSSCAAIGGVAPIIVDGLPYGTTNTYSAAVPAGAPLTGDVDAKYRGNLLQKSNAMFTQILARGPSVGKMAIGYSTSKQTVLILGQADGASGLDAEGMRSIFIGTKVDNAVFLDCSDSATLWYDGKFLISPGQDKNEFLTVAVGFK